MIKAEVIRVRNGDDRIDPHCIPKFRAQKGQNDRQRVSEASAFHNQVVELLTAAEYPRNGAHQVAVNRAADAAVVELNQIIGGSDNQLAIYSDIADLVDDNADFQTVLIDQDMIQ